MPVISSSIPSLANGVSQQPSSLRLSSQAELQENALSSVVKGVQKRPPTRHLAKILATTGNDSAYIHTINRDSVERYTVVLLNGDLKVYDMTGAAQTLSFPNGKTYLNTATPSTDMVALTVADYTFIVNKTVTTALASSPTAPTNHKQALVYVKQVTGRSSYTVVVNGTTVATYNTGSTPPPDWDTGLVASTLAGLMVTALGAGWTITVSGSVILVDKTSGDFTISTTDAQGDLFMYSIKDNIQRFADLPVRAFDGFRVKVTGDSTGLYTGYYVKFVDSNTSSNAGTWVETTSQGIKLSLDATKMPWQLVRTSAGHFTFDKATWDNRAVGDAVSAPDPSFIGRTFNDIFFHRNRLGFLSGENVILSKAGHFFDFYPDTVTQVLDSDRIDIASNHTKVSTLLSGVAFDDAFMCFSQSTQFVLAGADILTPKTVTLKPVTEFECVANVPPVWTGKVVYFPIPSGSYTGFREFLQLPVTGNKDALEITSHVPAYIPAGVFRVATNANAGTVVALTTGERNALYVYRYYWNGDQKLQSSWSKWTMASAGTDIILSADFIQTDLYLVIQRTDGVHLEVMHLAEGTTDVGFTFQVNLDRLWGPTGSYSSGTGLTTWTLPYAEPVSPLNGLQVVLGPAFSTPNRVGQVLTIARPSPTTITAVGDYSAGYVAVGRPYTYKYRLSTQYVKEPVKGGGPNGPYAAVTSGRLQLNNMTLSFDKTGYFRVEVTPLSRPKNTYVYTGDITGGPGTLVGATGLDTGTFTFPVLTRNTQAQIDIINDTYLPAAIQSFEWEGKYHLRSQRV